MFATLPLDPPAIADIRLTFGASAVAQMIEEVLKDSRNHLQESAGLNPGLSEAYAGLATIEEECEMSGWDGYDAVPVHPLSVALAQQFLEALPLGLEAPTVGSEPDGQVTLEWYRAPTRILSVSLSPEGELHYASLFGASKRYGSESFSGVVPESVLDMARKILG